MSKLLYNKKYNTVHTYDENIAYGDFYTIEKKKLKLNSDTYLKDFYESVFQEIYDISIILITFEEIVFKLPYKNIVCIIRATKKEHSINIEIDNEKIDIINSVEWDITNVDKNFINSISHLVKIIDIVDLTYRANILKKYLEDNNYNFKFISITKDFSNVLCVNIDTDGSGYSGYRIYDLGKQTQKTKFNFNSSFSLPLNLSTNIIDTEIKGFFLSKERSNFINDALSDI